MFGFLTCRPPDGPAPAETVFPGEFDESEDPGDPAAGGRRLLSDSAAREQEELRRYMEELEATRRKAARRLISEDSMHVAKLGEEAVRRMEEEHARRRAREEEERRRAEAEAEVARQKAEEKRLREEAAARERELAEQKRREEEKERQRLQAEKEARDRAEAAAKLAARQREAARLAREKEMKALVDAFLRQHGFNSISSAKGNLLRTTRPLHRAAELNKADVVRALLHVKADPAQKNSSGRTAYAVAKRKDKKGSHDAVLKLLTPVSPDATPAPARSKSPQRPG